MRVLLRLALLPLLFCTQPTSSIFGAEAFSVIKDPNNAGGLFFGGPTNLYADSPFFVDDTGAYRNNDFAVYSLDGITNFVGSGLSVSISNGENGIDQSLDGTGNTDINDDIPNAAPVNAAIAAVNAGGLNDGRLNNGNALRFSLWMRLDPNDSASTNALAKAPQIEPVLKLEFWKEALSSNADTNPGQILPGYGDKVFDQDQHGGPGGLDVDDMNQAQWVDVDNNGTTIDGDAASEGRQTTLSTDEWTLVEVTYTINDDPGTGDWLGIGDDYYDASAIEEIRAAFFWGDYIANNDLSGAGSIWVDNILFEVFDTEASLLATPNPNPDPFLDESDGLLGDYNGDGSVDAADYTVWRDGLSPDSSSTGYDVWSGNYGAMAPGVSNAVPEPTAAVSLLIACVAAAARRRVG